MSAHVVITLDTTPPVWTGVLVEDDNTMLATLSLDADATAFEVKVWGNIDPTWPGNANYAEHEHDAPWIPFEDILQLRLSGGKRIRVRVRDDLYNESDDQLFSVGTLPPPTPTTPEVPLGLPFEKPPTVERKTIVTRSILRFTTEYRVSARARRPLPGERVTRSRVVLRSRAHVSIQSGDSSSLLFRTRERRGALRSSGSSLRLTETATVHRRSEGPDTEAALVELDIL